MKFNKSQWKTVALPDIADIFRGGSPRPINNFITTESNGVNWLKIGDIQKNGKYIYSTSEKITPQGVQHSRIVNEGDFILSNSMSFGRPYIMKTSACIHDGWLTIQLKNKKMTNFLYYLLLSSYVQKQFVAFAQGSSVNNLKKELVSMIILILPPLEEQEEIANLLSAQDKVIDTIEKLIQAKQKQFRGLIQTLISEPAKKGVWSTALLSDVGKTYTGLSAKTKEDFRDGKPFITYTNVFQNWIVDPHNMGLVQINKNENQNIVQQGDFIFTTSSETPHEVGMSSYIQHEIQECYLNSFCFGYRMCANSNINRLFLAYYFRSPYFRSLIYKLAQGSTRYNISKTELMKERVSFPPLEEQEKIAHILATAQAEISKLKDLKLKHQLQKTGLMQEIFG